MKKRAKTSKLNAFSGSSKPHAPIRMAIVRHQVSALKVREATTMFLIIMRGSAGTR